MQIAQVGFDDRGLITLIAVALSAVYQAEIQQVHLFIFLAWRCSTERGLSVKCFPVKQLLKVESLCQ